MRAGVDFAAMMPAILAVPKTSPLGDRPVIRALNAAGDTVTTPCATARRTVTSLGLMSTIPARFFLFEGIFFPLLFFLRVLLFFFQHALLGRPRTLTVQIGRAS